MMIELRAGDYRLDLDPERGGSVARFDWRGAPLMRATCGPSVLDTASFPLVPFSNRIADGAFTVNGRAVRLTPNLPGSDHPHTLHGFGWLAEWAVVEVNEGRAVLEHLYPAGGEWPWPYRAVQIFTLRPDGLTMTLSVENRGDTPMPAGLGFHPYFPRTPDTIYRGLHRGEWQNTPDCLPATLTEKAEPADWWNNAPVGSRAVDTVYTERSGDLSILWPERKTALTLTPSDNLPFTVVYTPPGADFFCVEPVTHMTDAINANRADGGLVWLKPSETITAQVNFKGSFLK